jgi:hypothetical protein
MAINPEGPDRPVPHQTTVVQGEADPMQSWKAGKILADAIPGARFLLVPAVRHDLPRRIWPDVIDAMCGLTSPGAPAGSS